MKPSDITEAGTADVLARTARGAGWVMAWRLGVRMLGMISSLILVRLLAPADFGLMALAAGFMQTIDGMMMLGTEDAVIRAHAPTRSFYDTAFTLNLLRGLSVGALVAGLAWPAAAFFGDDRLIAVLLVTATLPVMDSMANIGAVAFRRDFAFQKEFAIMVLPKLAGILSGITVAFLLRSYVAMLVGMVVNRFMRMVMTYVMHPHRPRLTLRDWRGLVFYSGWTWLLSLAILLRERSDTLLLGRLTNPAMVGFYSVGAELAAMPTTEFLEPLGRAAFSGFAVVGRGTGSAADVFLRLVGNAAMITLPAGVGVSLVAVPLLHVAFGPGWAEAVPALQVLGLAGTVMAFGQLSQLLLSAHALLGRLVAIAFIGAALRIGLLLLLIPLYGITGAAIGVTVGSVLEQSLTLWTACRRFSVTPAALIRHVWRPVLGVLAMAAILVAAGVGWSDSLDQPVLTLTSSVLIGGATYTAVLLAAWNSAGRPEGAELDLLRALMTVTRRIRRLPVFGR